MYLFGQSGTFSDFKKDGGFVKGTWQHKDAAWSCDNDKQQRYDANEDEIFKADSLHTPAHIDAGGTPDGAHAGIRFELVALSTLHPDNPCPARLAVCP